MPESDKLTEFLGGRNAAREALENDPSRIVKVMLSNTSSNAFMREIRNLANQVNIPVQVVPPQRIDRQVPGVNHQGVVIQLSPVSYASVHDLLTQVAPTFDAVRKDKPIILLLDQLQDPYNFGAILRSAVAAGVDGVIIPERDAVPVNATVLKTSAGAAMKIPVARASNLNQVMEEMKERGYWLVGASAMGDTTCWDMDWDKALGIVIGGEEKGLRPAVAKHCDHLVSIPISANVESLNASVAAGVIMLAASKDRLTSGASSRETD